MNESNGLPGGHCPELETLSAFFDGELSESELTQIGAHAATCDRCSETLADFGRLRNALRATTPSVPARSLTIDQPTVMPTPISRGKITPLYPIATAIAAVLVLALIAGSFFSGNGSTSPEEPFPSGAVVVIDGTPFTTEDNDAEFGAASADVMNGEQDAARDQAADTDQDDALVDRWSLTLFIAGVSLLVFGLLWFREQRRRKR